MKTYVSYDFHNIYVRMCRDLMENPDYTVAPRGLQCREITNAVYTLTNVDNDSIDFSQTDLPERQSVYDSYKKAELDWYLSGNLRADSAPSKFWLKIADKDGNIVSNYGYMMLHKKMYTSAVNPQGELLTPFEKAVESIRLDRDSRQALLHYNLPEHIVPGNKDVVCTIAAQVLVRDNKLHMTVFQRSCDVIRGLSYDTPFHTFLLKKMAAELGLKPGSLTHHLTSLHVYEEHWGMCQKIARVKDEDIG